MAVRPNLTFLPNPIQQVVKQVFHTTGNSVLNHLEVVLIIGTENVD